MNTRQQLADGALQGELPLLRRLRTLIHSDSLPNNDSLEREISHISLRNMARAREAVAQMGTRYIGHPANHVQRIA